MEDRINDGAGPWGEISAGNLEEWKCEEAVEDGYFGTSKRYPMPRRVLRY